MKIYEKYRFLSRVIKFPVEIFTYSNELCLSLGELDFLLKLFGFCHFEKIMPNLQGMSEKGVTTKRSLQNAIKNLKIKGYLKSSQTRNEDGSFHTNIYDISGFLEKINEIKERECQLSMDFDVKHVFGRESNTLATSCIVYLPRVLDSLQKDLKISQKENILLKYLFAHSDDSFVSEVSLNIIAKTTIISRSTLTRAIQGLSEKGLIIVKEQFVGYGKKIRYKNRYDLNPLLEKLNEMERQKVENKLRAKGVWKDYSKKRKPSSLKLNSKMISVKQEESVMENKKERIAFVKNEIFRLKSQLTSKYGDLADQVRSYEQELNELQNNCTSKMSIGFLMTQKLKNMQRIHVDNDNPKEKKAKEICEKLRGNWERNRNLYVKSVTIFPNTVDRYVATTLEQAKTSKENYFSVCMKKNFVKFTT